MGRGDPFEIPSWEFHCGCCRCPGCKDHYQIHPETNTVHMSSVLTIGGVNTNGFTPITSFATPTGVHNTSTSGAEVVQSNSSDFDEMIQKLYSVRARPGQARFRNEILKVFGRCVVTGCTTREVLEAAHIVPHANGDENNQSCPSNGILLRADVHTLFDLNLLRVYSDDGITFKWWLDSSIGYLPGVHGQDCSEIFVEGRRMNLMQSGRLIRYV